MRTLVSRLFPDTNSGHVAERCSLAGGILVDSGRFLNAFRKPRSKVGTRPLPLWVRVDTRVLPGDLCGVDQGGMRLRPGRVARGPREMFSWPLVSNLDMHVVPA